jgi:predicted SPOUT superfamily RNA methylase MTH1
MRRLNVQDGQRITVKAGETSISLPVQVIEYLPTGYIGYPIGLAPTVSLAEPVCGSRSVIHESRNYTSNATLG